MDKEQINKLLERYLNGLCTEEEKQLLELWFTQRAANEHWEWESQEDHLATANQIRSHFQQVMKGAAVTYSRPQRFKPLAIAASFLFLVGTALCFYFFDVQKDDLRVERFQPMEQYALKETALLAFADGSQVLLDTVADGILHEFDHVVLRKVGQNELRYEVKSEGHSIGVQDELNQLIIPKGRDFKLTLVDGTQIWINAASSLTYPASFTGKERKISLNGEAYFEVAKNKSQPFKVMARHTAIYVMGTSFNVSAYDDEDRVVTTLAEGKVQVANPFKKMELAPSQQAINYVAKNEIDLCNVEVDSVLAWKNGYFVFENQDITAIMKNISRWYNIEVSYQGPVSKRRFGGTFSRTKSIVELLNYLESIGGIRFKQEGRRIIVMS